MTAHKIFGAICHIQLFYYITNGIYCKYHFVIFRMTAIIFYVILSAQITSAQKKDLPNAFQHGGKSLDSIETFIFLHAQKNLSISICLIEYRTRLHKWRMDLLRKKAFLQPRQQRR